VIVVICGLFFPYIIEGVCGDLSTGFSSRALLMCLEYGLVATFILERWILSPSPRLDKKTGYAIFAAALIVLLTCFTDYLAQNIIGEFVANVVSPIHFSLTHRILLYAAFILPIVYFLLLYPFDISHRRAFLLLISLCILYSYASITRIEVWRGFYAMPLHLCNTAMYIMPICLIFMWIGMFYFTMFVNVIGAFLAMLMPNYDETINFFSSRICQFYSNHIYAFFMPVLIILLGVFARPKIKYFLYSMIGFAAYFVLVSFLDIYYAGTAEYWAKNDPSFSVPNFFFLADKSSIAEKLGSWAENIFDQNTKLVVGDYTFVIRWPYLAGFFFVYVGLSFGMWYVYELLFQATDQLVLLHDKSLKRRAAQEAWNKKKALEAPNGATISHEPRLLIEHFTKRYAGAKTNAVTDFSLDLEGGKIYGFLGKNGAGKSTIIKAIVGMHGFDEGTITVCGYDVTYERNKAKEQIGFVPDNYALYETMTGRQYINYISDVFSIPTPEKTARLNELLDRLDMRAHFDKQMKTYSHGMKQKITIIGALIHDPKIWILDEPMTGVDPNSVFQIKELMRERAKRGDIVFFSSHLIDIVQSLCDEIIIIRHGDLVMRSSLSKLEEDGVDLEKLFLEKTADSQEEAETILAEEAKEEGGD
jgi:ABC-2 type transport system ATP-binding protein